ncbi:hypothetical protein [Lysinibacillus sp. NPDC056232]|uniref:hypothetical protein n=1 Tax=Lysinibacillus sp. NPDC056232 TaxID=3345756 RepID=UPI0035D9D1C4
MCQQMSFARKRSANVAAATGFVCAKAKHQQQHEVKKKNPLHSDFLPPHKG